MIIQNPPAPRARGPAKLVISKAKELVSVVDLVDRLCGPGKMRKAGDEWVTNCVIPDHDDHIPSFAVNPEKGLWFCHGCVRGGDAVRLAQLVWGHDRADTAAADLLLEFGHEIPPRPDSWYAKQKRQQPVRYALEAAKVRRVQRRIFRWLFAPIVARFEDEEERRGEAHAAWEEAGRIAFLVVSRAREAA